MDSSAEEQLVESLRRKWHEGQVPMKVLEITGGREAIRLLNQGLMNFQIARALRERLDELAYEEFRRTLKDVI